MKEWHLVGRLEDLSPDQPVRKTIGETNVLLLRSGDVVNALQDRCPHRFAPLSMGKIENGQIQCAYHGLRFGLDGACVFNPHGDGSIPDGARVRAFEVEQRDGDLFVNVN